MPTARHPQLNAQGQLKHLFSLEGLSRALIEDILDRAATFLPTRIPAGTIPAINKKPLLKGKSVFNLFFENSTRTRTTFEIAAKNLSADVINLNIAASSTSKGETLLDTIDNLAAMNANMFVVRHDQVGTPFLIAAHLDRQHTINVINAGDGRHAHPTQGLLDLYTIWHYKKKFDGLRVAIIGDILHSRVARTAIHGLSALGVPEIRVIAPLTLRPLEIEKMGVHFYSNIEQGLAGVDVIMMLRLQNERMSGMYVPSRSEYFATFGLTPERLALAAPNAIVLHPGPMNRAVEIDSRVADGPQSVILPQVSFGIAVRMAIMSLVTH